MQTLWTLRRVSGIGATTGLLAFALWPFTGLFDLVLLSLFVMLAAAAAFCGFSILLITIRDMATNPRRGTRIRPIRGFDTALALILLVLSWFELHDAIGLFPA
jgi:hypothetical protein